ncbi:MAG: histidine--tRNA ligase [Ignavibacteriae bacterium]|nr:histidine--tRNA ligase [Ignavibacteriota bacterium]MCB9217418.1 histidine--tRNA ligase [Ignavibacteria bacterium]
MNYQTLKGFRDLLPEETELWLWMEGIIRDLMRRYGFGELRLPCVEATELFTRGIGEGTDVVGKEMYSFLDRSDPPLSISLRPEMTAGAARAYVQYSIAQQQSVTRWYYVGPAFRYEQPQAGRYRQHSQFGVELIGSPRPEAEAEVLGLANDLLRDLGLSNYRLKINSLGMPQERTEFRSALVEFLRERSAQLSEDSRRRMEQNPLRVLDSKEEEDIEATVDAPSILEFLGEESRGHFQMVQQLLTAAKIPFEVDSRLVRGLDYYTRTVFEFVGGDLGAQNTLIGGGRYDNLIEEIGGKPAPAIGFGCGLDRLILSVQAANSGPQSAATVDAYIVALDDDARRWAVETAATLRRAGASVEFDLLGRSMKAQMREANRKGAVRAIIIGSNEMAAKVAQVKEMEANEQSEVPFDQLTDLITGKGKKEI